MNIPVLVTGGAGYIGSVVCKTLHNKGYLPITFDNLSLGHKSFIKWGPHFHGDLRNPDDLNQAFLKYQPQAVIHMAASAYVIESIHKPDKYYTNNVLGTINLLNAMINNNVDSLVFSSTCATYGSPQSMPIEESHPQNPINPYGKSKLMIERIIEDYQKAYPLQSCILRYFNAAGADLDLEVGESHDPETHLIPLVIHSAIGVSQGLTIYGSDFNTPDGTAVRDYIHVQDLANAHVLALEYIKNKQESLAVNLGTGTGSSILEIIQAVQHRVKNKVAFRKALKRQGEPAILVANNKKAKSTLNWQPKYSSLDMIVDTAYQWQLKCR
ncbi:MAG: UDP-glucose 4-epimerase GalE [Chlamydiae bacterium CG10_big_fil_rev_8_21_14_0_10_35_9]|nr:MAG: UDP-glucose 4-epimerase GalE [Chlamydiae bacterium CG10_big_fil_rev_8_21_14_0_10_35_9]